MLSRYPPAIYDDVVMTALRRDPQQRFANALDFARALDSALIAQNQLVDFGALAEWRQTLHPTVVALDDVLEREPDTVMRSEETQRTVTAMETPLEPMTEPSPIEPPFEPPVLDKRGSSRVHVLLSLVSAVISVLCFSGVAALAWNPRASSGWAGVWLSANVPALRASRPAPARMQQTPIGPFMLEVWSRDDDGQKKLIWQQSVDATTEGATTEGHQGHRSRRPPRVYGYSYDTLPHDL